MPQIPYRKPYAPPADLVQHLIQRGLTINNSAFAEQKISEIGYDRLRIYFSSRRRNGVEGKPFQAGITFDDIMMLYTLDEELRALCFFYCSKFELSFRNVIAEVLSAQHGPHPYFDDSIYDSDKSRLSAVKYVSEIFHKSKDQRAKHYFAKYNPPYLPPIWTVKEFMTFGSTNLFLKTLSKPMRGIIADKFGINNRDIFEKWIDAFIDFRNICAHHDRLWNRAFQKSINKYKRGNIPSDNPSKLRAIVEAMEYTLNARGHSVHFKNDVILLIGRYPAAHPSELGF